MGSPANCNKRVQPVCLPGPFTEPSTGDKVTVTGWGTLKSGGKQPKTLMKVHVPIVDHATCISNYAAQGYDVTDNMICAGLENGGKDSCQGDSGGPLVLKDTNEQVGIVSWGIGCAWAGFPGVYTNLVNYNDWIATKIIPS